MATRGYAKVVGWLPNGAVVLRPDGGASAVLLRAKHEQLHVEIRQTVPMRGPAATAARHELRLVGTEREGQA